MAAQKNLSLEAKKSGMSTTVFARRLVETERFVAVRFVAGSNLLRAPVPKLPVAFRYLVFDS